jgi:hypothetical protein
MLRQRHLRGTRCGLLCLSLALASTAHAQPAPPPATVAPPVAAPGPPPPAYAPPPVYPVRGPNPDPDVPGSVRGPGAQTHDGFYLRLQTGFGYTRLSTNTMGSNLSIAGLDESFGIALGGAINPHVIIYGTLIGSPIRNPKSKNNGPLSSAVSDGMLSGTVTVGGYGDAGAVGFGAGAAYYLYANVFFAGSLLASRLFVEGVNGGVVAKSDWGFTFGTGRQGMVGLRQLGPRRRRPASAGRDEGPSLRERERPNLAAHGVVGAVHRDVQLRAAHGRVGMSCDDRNTVTTCTSAPTTR